MNTTSPFARIPPSRKERWQVLRDVVADWLPALSSHDGYEDPVGPVQLPVALREWYQLCGKRADIWSRQDHWNTPLELYEQSDHLVVIVENQSCAFWGIPVAELHNDDPPVFVDMDGNGNWLLENSTTTEFALQMLAFNIKWANEKCWANGCGNEAALERVRDSYPRFAFPDWNWPVRPTRSYLPQVVRKISRSFRRGVRAADQRP